MKSIRLAISRMSHSGGITASMWLAFAVVFAGLAGVPGVLLAAAGEASAPPSVASTVKGSTNPPAATSAEQWRGHPSYQVLESRAELPAMEAAAKGTLKIGGRWTLELQRATELPAEQKQALAAQFEVPVAAFDKFLQRLASRQGLDAEQGAKELRTLIIDYRYLRDRWNQYRPPAGQQKLKTDALQSLDAGDLDKAWQMFVALSPPAPPSQLQATKAP